MAMGIMDRLFGKQENDTDELEKAAAMQRDLTSRQNALENTDLNKQITSKRTADDELISALKMKLHESKEERRWFEPQWAMNRAHYSGNQWVEWDGDSQALYVPAEQRARIQVNRTRSVIRNLIAKLTRNRPILQAIPPDSGDPSDRNAAKISELFLDYELPRLDFREHLQDALQWFYIEGKSFIGVHYNPNKGDIKKAEITVTKYKKRQVMAMGEMGPMLDHLGQPLMLTVDDLVYTGKWPVDKKLKPIRFDDESITSPKDLTEDDLKAQFEYCSGEIELDVYPLNEIYWEPGAIKLSKSRWVMHRRRQSLDDIRGNPMFKNTENVIPDGNNEEEYNFEASIGIGSYRSYYGYRDTEAGRHNNCADVFTYYQRPSMTLPRGLMVCWAGNVLLYRGPLPIGEIPIVEFKELNEPNRFAPSSIVEQIMPIQHSYNMSRSQLLEYVKQVVIGVWIYKKNSCDTPPIGYAGEHIEYNTADGKPERMQNTPLPNSIMDSLQVDKDDISELSGLYETSRGIGTTDVKSGIHAKLLMEADDTKLGPVTDLIEMATEKIGNLILAYARKFYKEERLLRIAGKNRGIQVKAFMGADLKADVVVLPGSALSQSKIIKQQEIKENWSGGYYGDPKDPAVRRHVYKLLEDGSNVPMSSVNEANMLQAGRENEEAREGRPIQSVKPWDDHSIHSEEHTEWIVSEEAIKAGEQAQQAMWQHIMGHRAEIAKAMNPNIAPAIDAMMGSQGGGQQQSPQGQQGPEMMPQGQQMAAMS